MKWITYILLIVISTLTLIPCSDGRTCTDSTEQAPNDHSDHENHCTPFCTCTCCGSVVTVFASIIDFKGDYDLAGLYEYPYSFDYSYEFHRIVWHPPILS